MQHEPRLSGFLFRSKLSLFQSKSSLQRANVKVRHLHIYTSISVMVNCGISVLSVLSCNLQLKAKRSECNSKATHARNDYLLTLQGANAHQQRYYNTDLMDCIKVRTHTQSVGGW